MPRLQTLFRNIKLRTWIAIGVIIILLPVILISLYRPTGSEAAWFDDAYTYRKKITFTHNAALTDRRISITVDTATLTTDKMQADCDDTRFTDINGLVLRFQEVSGCDTSTTQYDVLVPTIISGQNVFYMYYGSPAAVNASEDISSFTSLSPSGGDPSQASEEKGPGPVAYWKLDEGYGTTTQDTSSNNNDGTITGATWRTEDMCISGKCLYFDGTVSTKVQVSDHPSLDITNAYTITTWFKVNTLSENKTLFDKGAGGGGSGGWRILDQGNGRFIMQIDSGVGSFESITLQTATTVTTDTWYHLAITYDGTTARIYLNGLEEDTATDVYYSLANNSDPLLLGITDAYGSGNELMGFLDEPKIFNYARSANHIKTEYNSRGANEGVSASFGKQSQRFLSDGLLGHWKMDESSWNGTSNEVVDYSGNASHGTRVGDATTTGGKYGSGGTFDGTGDYVNFTNTTNLQPTSQITIATWIKASSPSTFGRIVSYGTSNIGYELITNQTTGTIQFYLGTGSSAAATSSNTAATDNTWHHVVGTWDGATMRTYIDGVQQSNTASFAGPIGGYTGTPRLGFNAPGGSHYYSGQIDETRIYNRALSSAEITALYNWAPGPVGYWKFDENTGTTTTSDSSGSGYSGSMSGFAASAWVNGKYGAALDFDGSDDNISVGDQSALDVTDSADLTISGWFYRDTSTTNDPIIAKRNDVSGIAGSIGYILNINDGNDRLQFTIDDGTDVFTLSPTTAFTTPAWYHFAVVWDQDSSSNTDIYINGVAQNSTETGTIGNINDVSNALSFSIGNQPNGGEDFDGRLDDIRVYNYVQTTSKIIEDMNGGHPIGGSPIASQLAWWKFDEQQGQTANNSGNAGSTINGTLGANTGSSTDDPTWKTESNCKIKSCLSFDGGDYVIRADDNSLDITGEVTLSAWVNLTSTATSYQTIIGKRHASSTSVNYALRTGVNPTSDEFDFYFSSGGSYQVYRTSNANISASTWYHVAATYTVGSLPKIYLNGKLLTGSCVTGTCIGAMSGDSNALGVGRPGDFANEYLTGSIDEVKVYNAALTEEQIRIDMNAGSGINFGVGAPAEASLLSDGAGNPPIAYWTFDEKNGTTVTDSSGNNISTTFSVLSWQRGKVGSGLYFNNSGYLDFNDVNSLDFGNTDNFSISGWINNESSSNDMVVAKYSFSGAGYYVDAVGTKLTFFMTDGSNSYTMETANDTVPDNVWTHFYIVVDEDSATNTAIYLNGIKASTTNTGTLTSVGDLTNAADFRIGTHSGGGDPFSGTMDEIKIYNYFRTPAQVAYDYNRGAPIAHWKLNECQGTTVNDTAGNGLSGTITPGASGNTAAGNCTSGDNTHMWSDGATGKYGASLDFDGTDDYVTFGNPSLLQSFSQLTISAWINGDSLPSGDTDIIFYKETSGFYLGIFDQKIRFRSSDLSSDMTDGTTTLNNSTWHHVTATWDGSTVRLYLDGKLDASEAGTGTISENTANAMLGSFNAASLFFDGRIDDVRIYNYSLSADQIKKLYNDNSGVRFGPSEGQP